MEPTLVSDGSFLVFASSCVAAGQAKPLDGNQNTPISAMLYGSQTGARSGYRVD
jgi:hypothetical protein